MNSLEVRRLKREKLPGYVELAEIQLECSKIRCWRFQGHRQCFTARCGSDVYIQRLECCHVAMQDSGPVRPFCIGFLLIIGAMESIEVERYAAVLGPSQILLDSFDRPLQIDGLPDARDG